MKKFMKCAAVVAALAMALSLASCGEDDDDDNSGSGTEDYSITTAPTITSITAGTELNTVVVNWTAATSPSASIQYKVYFTETDNASAEAIGSLSPLETSSTLLLPSLAISAAEQKTYYFFVKATNGWAESNALHSEKTSASKSYTATIQPFPVPTNVKKTATVGECTVTWDAVDGATGYFIYELSGDYDISNGKWALNLLKTVDAPATTATVTVSQTKIYVKALKDKNGVFNTSEYALATLSN